jgi:transcriptional regulator with XRE-family HTH domain
MTANGHGEIGDRLRRERAERGLSLRELARRLDVSPSLVSQIETGKIQPSVRTLYAMVSELGISLDDVFHADGARAPEPEAAVQVKRGSGSSAGALMPAESAGHVQRHDSRPVVDLESGVRWERLTARNESGVEFLLTIYPSGSESGPPDALVRHTGREFGIVLKGNLGLTVGFDEYTLAAGDSVFFDSTVPHRLHNDGEETVEAVWVVLGRQP